MRQSNWLSNLNSYIDKVRTIPFQYGHMDCCMFAGGAVEAVTGLNFHGEFEGRYSDHASGEALVLTEKGFSSSIMYVQSIFPIRHKSLGVSGDLAVVKDNQTLQEALGVVVGSKVYYFNPNGLSFMDLLECKRILKVI